MFAHVRRRVLAWSNPWADIDNKGYQITQSLFAIGTGGWFGMGLCQGMPGKIPVVEKDFIFAAVSEEMGGIFAICVLLICLGCFIQFMMIAASMQAVFYKLIAFGLGIEYISQVFLRRDQIHTIHRRDAALCELWGKFHTQHVHPFRNHTGAVYIKEK